MRPPLASAASVLAQQWLAEEKSMVRARLAARFAACACGCFGLVRRMALRAGAGAAGSKRHAATAADTFLARDGEKLPLRKWAADHPNAVIIALHGMSDYSDAFAMPGRGGPGTASQRSPMTSAASAKRPIRACGPAAMRCARSDDASLRRAHDIRACPCLRWAKAWAVRWCSRRWRATIRRTSTA